MSKEVFELTRFLILKTKLENDVLISDAFSYAWNHRVYPLFQNNNLAESMQDDFDLNKDLAEQIYLEIDKCVREEKELKYYNLEYKFGRGNRCVIIDFIKYAFLSGAISLDVVKQLYGEGCAPCEAGTAATIELEDEISLEF